MSTIKPQKLQKGDTVAIVSPSWGGPSVFPHIYELGLKALKDLGLRVKEFPSARKDAEFLYKNPRFRARDINKAFADKSIKAIFASIGGDDSVRILPFLNIGLIRKNPKIIMGYSDITTLLTYLNQHGLVTLHGPTVMAGFTQWKSLGRRFQQHIKTILFENPTTYTYKPYSVYYEGYLDWSKESNAGKLNRPVKNNGWQWLQGRGKIRGKLFGGCIEVLEFIKGTRFWTKQSFWKDKVLFIETSDDKPTPEQIKWILRNYGIQGILNQISALLIGRARDYTRDEKKELYKTVLRVVREEFGNLKIPIIANMDFGHTDPQWILPLGIKVEIDCVKKEFRLAEKIFK